MDIDCFFEVTMKFPFKVRIDPVPADATEADLKKERERIEALSAAFMASRVLPVLNAAGIELEVTKAEFVCGHLQLPQ